MNENITIGTMPILALRGLVVFPEQTVHFEVGRVKSVLALEEAMKKDFPIKAAGLTYVNFAKEHPKLFKLLFMSDVGEITQHYFPGGDIKVEPVVRTAIGSHYDMTDESARKLYNHISIYTHGIAVLFAEGNTTFSDKDVSEMLKEAFFAFKEAVTNEKCN
jgi:ATP-dependent Lon protease